MERTEWAPSTGAIVGCGAAGLMLAISAVSVIDDPPGRVLVGLAALGLVVFAAMSWRTRPKLVIGADGLVVNGWWRTQWLGRPDVETIRISEFRRIGRTARLLEIETTDDRLVILSRWDVGADPVEVLDVLTAAGYTPS